MRLPLFHLDAFTSEPFKGNPAAVCPLQAWPDDHLLQSIAAENNLAETAFILGGNGDYHIRWMTPQQEVDLCGHATLASAFVILDRLEPGRTEVRFTSKGGPLVVRKDGDLLVLDFPALPAQPVAAPEELIKGLGRTPREVLLARDYLAVFDDEEDVKGLRPDMEALLRLGRAVIVTAPGRACDFVSRFFAPNFGIPEDPVTGSAHCTLTPYWSRRLGRTKLRARQVSARGGELTCEEKGDRILIAGRVVPYLEGTIQV